MCSISGFAASKPLPPEMALRLSRALLFYGAERGKQSAGIYTEGQLLKRAITPDAFGVLPEFAELFKGGAEYALIHTRAPTCGERGDEQAQPFVTENGVVTIHNGVLTEPAKVATDFGIEWPSGVDSELFATFIAKYGVFKLPKLFRSAQGSMAVAAFIDGRIYLMRDSNPIETFRLDLTDGTKIMLFASTRAIIEKAIQYCWLIGWTPVPSFLPHMGLYRLNAKKGEVQEIGRPPDPTKLARNLGRHWSQEHDWEKYRKEARERANTIVKDGYHITKNGSVTVYTPVKEAGKEGQTGVVQTGQPLSSPTAPKAPASNHHHNHGYNGYGNYDGHNGGMD